ncbi:SDR family NAD(P)-dependent oxidoreductase [Filimonas effusa]|uniref:SDR family NAD(P)-dependent oxidoreductase n=1 Tax=Filimonas effusa TaxID=2508721 RepID=A0A4Q1D221_9BACT|nr:SDR family NAD(P)-dependent oxidoreductase [Filimonas effusa]RXK81247.1 SDR family NAD(P)-dependent oxidoreductase [Filimonas effusa]
MKKVVFITGASKGFGRHWAEALLQQGYAVVATARKLSDLNDLTEKYAENVLPLQLDVTNRSQCHEAVAAAVEHFHRIDILISNAGYGHFGFIEELTEEEARKQFETNVFGSLWIIQAVVPIMREQQSGHILQVSSIGGITAFPSLGIYNASKWAIEGLCEALGHEVGIFGVKVTLIEPAGYATDWQTVSSSHSNPIAAYQPVRDHLMKMAEGYKPGNPSATSSAILKVIEAANPPSRLLLGAFAWPLIAPVIEQRMDTWKEWLETSQQAQ